MKETTKPGREVRPEAGRTLRTYWVSVCVELYSEIFPEPDDEDDDPRADVGYFRNFGITAASEREARELAAAEASDGEITWGESAVTLIDPALLDPVVLAKSQDWTERGVWYRSGRMLFPED